MLVPRNKCMPKELPVGVQHQHASIVHLAHWLAEFRFNPPLVRCRVAPLAPNRLAIFAMDGTSNRGSARGQNGIYRP